MAAKAAKAAQRVAEELAKHEKEYLPWHQKCDETKTTGEMNLLVAITVPASEKRHLHGYDKTDVYDLDLLLKPNTNFYHKHVREHQEVSMKELQEMKKEMRDELQNTLLSSFLGSYSENSKWENHDDTWKDLTGWEEQAVFDDILELIVEEFMRTWSRVDFSTWRSTDDTSVRTVDGTELILQYGEKGREMISFWAGAPEVIQEIAKGTEEKKEIFNIQQLLTSASRMLAGEERPNGVFESMEGQFQQHNRRKEDGSCPDFLPPWAIAGPYSEIHRWFFQGTGTTTHVVCSGVVEQWDQEDVTGDFCLTDRERMYLKQALQLTVKASRRDLYKFPLDIREIHLLSKIKQHVEAGPWHNPALGIFQFRVKSLKKRMRNCVFFSKCLETLPQGSVADKVPARPEAFEEEIPLDPLPPNLESLQRDQNEVIEFYKYGKKIGAIRAKYVLEDRFRLLDMIEEFTPDFLSSFKTIGLDSDGQDHTMSSKTLQHITDITALAMDLSMPDYREDFIACFLKTQLEELIGPTWHIIVGRSFGYSIAYQLGEVDERDEGRGERDGKNEWELRYVCRFRMRHLAILVWKSEPEEAS
ncbi:hypothetical protein GUITHDRAFT_111907 [Guillardia theta CCMP2712]|uniref:Uncharacterized protein n=1 Tax=Guillardia theta (strain CCMP2712) TaxID=905079 RepID=L1J1N7_GUITC|nr:hypothetical protein GUITHDRAFT_111907 [Guillardia theta CCMP2712]EKX42054.1 hypothetical protein GUITHDRAFT_111907 [Guillardia theta CCMP2712]|eukprot:XP_005829034.1 hypothetical protein GUITHDRAFT_111907 [Guillardia theta CCMP2712]